MGYAISHYRSSLLDGVFEVKLPIIEAMHTAPTGKKVQLTRHLSFEVSVSAPEFDGVRRDVAEEVRTKAILQINQLSRDPRETPYLQEQARRMVMHEIYGPVRERLQEILTMLFESGPMYDDKIAKAVDELMDDLK